MESGAIAWLENEKPKNKRVNYKFYTLQNLLAFGGATGHRVYIINPPFSMRKKLFLFLDLA